MQSNLVCNSPKLQGSDAQEAHLRGFINFHYSFTINLDDLRKSCTETLLGVKVKTTLNQNAMQSCARNPQGQTQEVGLRPNPF